MINKDKNEFIKTPEFSPQQKEISDLLISTKEQFDKLPKVILLGHKYTPSNFSLQNLKGHDKPRDEALLSASEQVGYYASLVLLTHYQNGESKSGYYHDDDYSSINREIEKNREQKRL